MADSNQDLLSEALIDLQNELKTFGKIGDALEGAHKKLTAAEKEWERLTVVQQENADNAQKKWAKAAQDQQKEWSIVSKSQQDEWIKLSQEQQEKATKLVKATEDAIIVTKSVTVQTQRLTESILPLAKAIENVNFPLRLDKIDLAVSSQLSSLSSLQGTTERGFGDLRGKIEYSSKAMDEGFALVGNQMMDAKKKAGLITILLAVNSAVLIVIAIMFYFKFVASHG